MNNSSMPHILKAGLIGMALVGLSACATKGPAPTTAPPLAGLEVDKWRDKIKVTPQPDEIQLVAHATGVSETQDQALRALVGRWLSAEGREIVVSAPVGGPGSGSSGRMAAQVRDRLMMYGAPAPQVRIIAYDAAGSDAATIRVGFQTYVAEGPRCGDSWENLTATRNNEAYGNFGCAMAANLAAQIANPEDLLRPRDSAPIDAGRRDTVLGKYRKGEVTSSAKDDQAKGTISKAIN